MPAEGSMVFIIAPLLIQRLFIANPIPGWPSVQKEISRKLILIKPLLQVINQVICFLENMRVCTRYLLHLPIPKLLFPTQTSIGGLTAFPILQKLYKKL